MINYRYIRIYFLWDNTLITGLVNHLKICDSTLITGLVNHLKIMDFSKKEILLVNNLISGTPRKVHSDQDCEEFCKTFRSLIDKNNTIKFNDNKHYDKRCLYGFCFCKEDYNKEECEIYGVKIKSLELIKKDEYSIGISLLYSGVFNGEIIDVKDVPLKTYVELKSLMDKKMIEEY